MYKDMGMERGPGDINEQEVVIVFPEIFSPEEMDKFKEESDGLINSGKIYITLDFGKCEFIDSTGLGPSLLSIKSAVRHWDACGLSPLVPLL